MYKSILRNIQISLDEEALERSSARARQVASSAESEFGRLTSLSDRYATEQSVRLRGDSCMFRFRKYMKEIDAQTPRSDHQRIYTEAMLRASARIMYGNQFFVNAAEILRRNNWETMPRQEVLLACPRRFGKTWATSMFVACFCMAVPKCSVCIFSPSKRQSILFKETVGQFIKSIKGGSEMIIKQNEESIFLRGDDSSDVRKVNAYPASSATTKVSCVIFYSIFFY